MKKRLFSAAVTALLLLCLWFAVSCIPSSEGKPCGSHDYDHDYGETVILTAPTCTAEGSGKRVCRKCGYEKTGIVLPANGHTFGRTEVTRPATCTAEGEAVQTCTVCGAENRTALSRTAHRPGETETVREATCQAEGETVRRCLDCGYGEPGTLPKTDHRYEETDRREATCENAGLITLTCPMCGTEKTEVTDRLGHRYASPAAYIYDDLGHADPHYCYYRYQHCERCDRDIRTGSQSHSMTRDAERSVDATCVSTGLAAEKCRRCAYRPAPAETAVDPSHHVRVVEKADAVDASTCRLRQYGECEGCHRVTWEMQVASHDYADLTLECRRTGCGAVRAAGSSWFEYSFFNDGFAIKKLTDTAAFAEYLASTGGQVRLPTEGTRTVGGTAQSYEIRVIAGDLFKALDADIAASVVSVYVPEGYAQVNAYAFRGLTSLATLHLPASITGMETRSLEGCTALTTLTLPHIFNTKLKSLFGVPVGGENTSVLTTLKLHRGTGSEVALSSEALLGFSFLMRVEQATGSVGGITYALDGTPFSVTDAGTKTVYRNGRDDADGFILFVLVHGV